MRKILNSTYSFFYRYAQFSEWFLYELSVVFVSLNIHFLFTNNLTCTRGTKLYILLEPACLENGDCTIFKTCCLIGAVQEKFRLGQSQDVGISRKGEVVRFPPANPVRLDLQRSVLDINWDQIFISVITIQLSVRCYITVNYAIHNKTQCLHKAGWINEKYDKQ